MAQGRETSRPASESALIVIDGLCDRKNVTKSPDCKTVITKSQFEGVIDAIQPDMSKRARRDFALDYANALIMAKKAKELGLDRGENYEEQIELARLDILTRSLRKAIQTRASQISDKEIQDYYDKNRAMFERAEVDRLYIPERSNLEATAVSGPADVAGQGLAKKFGEGSISEANALHASAVAGSQFAALQVQAYREAGIERAVPDTKFWIRRVSLPPSQRAVMDLQPGEVSPVLKDPNGYMIYRMIRKELLPVDQVHDQIRETLRVRKVQDAMRDILGSFTTTLDPAYFKP